VAEVVFWGVAEARAARAREMGVVVVKRMVLFLLGG
jgi:hypothetical protein